MTQPPPRRSPSSRGHAFSQSGPSELLRCVALCLNERADLISTSRAWCRVGSGTWPCSSASAGTLIGTRCWGGTPARRRRSSSPPPRLAWGWQPPVSHSVWPCLGSHHAVTGGDQGSECSLTDACTHDVSCQPLIAFLAPSCVCAAGWVRALGAEAPLHHHRQGAGTSPSWATFLGRLAPSSAIPTASAPAIG